MTAYVKRNWAISEDLNLHDLQLKTTTLLCLTTITKPRSDIGRLQSRDVHFTSDQGNIISVTLQFHELKEKQVKTSQFGTLQDPHLCPAKNLSLFVSKTQDLRTTLSQDHTLFLSYIQQPDRTTSIQPTTMANWVKQVMSLADINTNVYEPHLILSTSSTKAVEKGHSIQAVKEHAG